jgi:tetratricopeptide (TPR) repeat protein
MSPYVAFNMLIRCASLMLFILAPGFAEAGGGPGGHHHGGSPGHHGHPGGLPIPYGIAPGGYFPIVIVPPIATNYVPPPIVMPPRGGGLMLPNPANTPPARLVSSPARAKAQASKAEGYVNLGDNLFRAKNYHRAEQRYTQAAEANPASATPHIRLAQISMIRGDYAEAAAEFRAAMSAEPGWLVNAVDVQRIFGEPADFAQALGKLETHLQASPGDRDGWLVLGAEWFLSGRTRQAADVFTRLNDRKPDSTLAAFLDATSPDAIPRDAR